MIGMKSLIIVHAGLLVGAEAASLVANANALVKTASRAVLPSFVSYSIEFSSFPDFAGNLSEPNHFSDNLLNNIRSFTGSKPIIRVGGNTEDFALYNPSLKTGINATYTALDADYPTIIDIGDSYFESYQTWPGTQFTHGFNLAASNTSRGNETITKTAALACKALAGGKLLAWEMGNEPDLYPVNTQLPDIPKNYTEANYVQDWLRTTRQVKSVVSKACPDEPYGYIAPSFAGIHNSFNDTLTWAAGINTDKDIKLISQHNYISGAMVPGVTLDHTLLNHTMTLQSLSQYLPSRQNLTTEYQLPYILGETNSLYNQGKPGLSNSFGAALWTIDYLLTGAALGMRRIHLHQGTNYRYQSWQPVDTDKVSKGTKAPYYGAIAAAAALGDLSSNDISVQTLVAQEKQVAHAVSQKGNLRSVMLINLQQYNYTTEQGGINTQPRPNSTFTVQYSGWKDGMKLNVQRLLANGSDTITGISLDGFSYNYELKNGKPVRLNNVTTGEIAVVSGGSVQVQVPESSAALLTA